jgi:NAD(P)H-quinone oxidoreductase subunit 5
MNIQLLAFIALLPPLACTLTAILSWFQQGIRPKLVKRMGIISSLLSILVAGTCSVLVAQNGLIESAHTNLDQWGFTLRLDAVSLIMFAMIALLSYIVMRFSLNYLDGDTRQGIFLGRMAATIASVQLFVLSGNLMVLYISWILTSISLHRLLVFYKDRPRAIIAARKKFIIARLADACLLAAFILLYNKFGTGNLEVIFQELKESIASSQSISGMETIAVLIAAAALLKSAQFPTHGWLIEVMETPTPVSALLHAGLLNAGPFLIIRMAFVMEASTSASMLLIILGGFTAIFASVVFLTQTSIKTALGYSSVAHMGFSLMVCGLGLYPAAMLHLVAHSFYKAHSFLSSGSVIDSVRATKAKSSVRTGNLFKIAISILMALGVYSTFALIWGLDPKKDIALMAIGAVIVMGLSRLFASAIDSTASFKLFIRASLLAILVAAAFFLLESGAHHLIASQVPELGFPSFTELILIGVILLLFGIVIFIQIASPLFTNKPSYQALSIHVRNGLYVNTLFDRIVRALYSHNYETLKQRKQTK